jgi:cytochrome oxidase Cu insertion factor (SCO1/SenC/PrrC family)
MRPIQKVLTTVLWGLTVLAMVSVIGAGLWRRGGSAAGGGGSGAAGGAGLAAFTDEADGELAVLAAVPAFSLMDQNGQTITLETLKGKTWVADFVFTRCAGPCSTMTAKMAALQKTLPPQVKLVSFSVDPEHDTPAVLKEYATIFKADESRWHFLTGEKSAIFSQARGMLLTAIPASETNAIIHDERFLLIDADGNIRGAYHSKNENEMKQLDLDADRLVKESKESKESKQ